MILAAILRNYKCYKGINIIPFCGDDVQDMNIIIGNNGVGKSAILEGLDTFFNDAPWIVNKDVRGKNNEAAVGVVMLVLKDFADSILDEREKGILEEISNYFWTIDENNAIIRRYKYGEFINIRSKVESHRSDYYLLIAGRDFDEKDVPFLTFTKTIMAALTVEPKPTTQTVVKLIDKVLSLYTYIYIPVETSISEFVKLQNQSMQTLTDSNVKEDISANLKKKFITHKKSAGRGEKRSLLDYVNDALEGYVSKIEHDIQQIYSGYSYKPAPHQTSKLTANHITDAIISAYYSRRSFKKDGKDIQNLSSGEKRLILIDIISAFLKKDNPRRELIIGIDEPENSLHISKCYNQFKKIEEIAVGYGHQLFVTTHWYGSLPSLSQGNLIHIDTNSTPSIFSISNYYEDRGGLPEDIQLKGYFDLTSSLLYAFRESRMNWLLVEGYEDMKYLQFHLKDRNVRIIPLGGCGNVKKLYEYLYVPMSSNEFKHKTTKIICLIDTDALCPPIGMPSGDDNSVLLIRRLQEGDNGETNLMKIEDPTRRETEVEEILDPKKFYDALSAAIGKYGDDEDKAAMAAFSFDDTAKTSRIKGDGGILKLNTLERNANEDKQRIIDFVDSHKDMIANEYVSKPYSGAELSWVAKLKSMMGLRTV